jgi:hypothetical protein
VTEYDAIEKVYAALRNIQEQYDLRGSQMVRATLAALLRIAPQVAHDETDKELHG